MTGAAVPEVLRVDLQRKCSGGRRGRAGKQQLAPVYVFGVLHVASFGP